jgi:putative glycosyltransferase (TIGR04372 family)
MTIKDFLILIIYSPVLLIIKVLSPLVSIRFGHIKSSHLGFSLNESILYILEKREFQSKRSLDVFGLDKISANQQVITMLKREVFASKLITPFISAINKLPAFKDHLVLFRKEQYFDIHGLIAQNSAVLKFTNAEHELGEAELQRIGITKGSKFVCLCIRDSAYDQKAGGQKQSNLNTYRNTKTHDYLDAIKYLIKNEVFVIRMGASIEQEIELDSPFFINYAIDYRTEFLDIFLCANCYFYFGDSAGLVNVARIFKRPIALCNWIPMGLASTQGENTIIIHKKIMDKSGNEIPLSQHLSSKCVLYETTHDYEKHNLTPIDNTAEENLALVKQMSDELEGRWQEPKDYAALEQNYWSYFKTKTLREPICSKIAYSFLKKNLNNES